MIKCIPCVRGLHHECRGCTCTHQLESVPIVGGANDSNKTEESDSVDWRKQIRNNSTNGRGKRDAALKDQQSTGRKRAARLYPLERDNTCEWRMLANCGGGIIPILGCTNGLQSNRHHGPDKAVTNNEFGNVHRICTWCHAEWHAKNNAEYDWKNTIFKTHSPRPMTDKEQFDAVIRDEERKQRKIKRVRD